METLIIINQYNAYNATVAPTVNDDSTLGYKAGNNASRWFDTTTGKLYVCTSAAIGAAVWKLVSFVQVIQAVIVGNKLAVSGDVEFNIPVPYAAKILTYKIYAQDAPSGSASVVGLKKNGSSITTTGASVASGANFSNTTPVFSSDTVAENDLLTPTFTSIGSTSAGKRFTITIHLQKI